MSTIREGTKYFRRYVSDETSILCIQYGLVDAWRSFRYAPYVLYYPDNPARRVARKLVKKFKKLCGAGTAI